MSGEDGSISRSNNNNNKGKGKDKDKDGKKLSVGGPYYFPTPQPQPHFLSINNPHHQDQDQDEDDDDEDQDDDDDVSDHQEHKHHQMTPSCGAQGNNQNHNPTTTSTSTSTAVNSSAAAAAPSTLGGVGVVEVGGYGTRESSSSLRLVLSDPITGSLLHDAFILPCGHSFGATSIHHLLTTTKSCYTCSLPVSQQSVLPNLSLRVAVQAFCREEELRRSSKRRRDRHDDQDKGGTNNGGDSNTMDSPRGRGVQFPFAVTDRVIIKGNKRTPQRFVGREAVVTTQCLNGWYVVKTLDNAESVKLQYRSLAKVSDVPSSKTLSSKMTPSWL